MNKVFVTEILKVKEERPNLVVCKDEVIWESYNIGRTYLRGSQTRSRKEGVPDAVIDLVNKWQKVKRNKRGKPSGSMRDHYTEIRLIRKRLLSYSLPL